jgi:hypothetical protein
MTRVRTPSVARGPGFTKTPTLSVPVAPLVSIALPYESLFPLELAESLGS